MTYISVQLQIQQEIHLMNVHSSLFTPCRPMPFSSGAGFAHYFFLMMLINELLSKRTWLSLHLPWLYSPKKMSTDFKMESVWHICYCVSAAHKLIKQELETTRFLISDVAVAFQTAVNWSGNHHLYSEMLDKKKEKRQKQPHMCLRCPKGLLLLLLGVLGLHGGSWRCDVRLLDSCFLTHSTKASTWRSPLFVLRLRARMAFYRSSVQCFPKVVGG